MTDERPEYTPSSSKVAENASIITDDDEKSEEYDPEHFAPFQLLMIYGYDKKLGIRILNKNPDEDFCIYSLGHVASIMNLKTKTSHHLLGHDSTLLAIEHDRKGNYLVTADLNTVMIWDIGMNNEEQPVRLRIINRPFGKGADIARAALSYCGKYLVVASKKTESGTMVEFWRWSFAQEEFDAKFNIAASLGSVQSIRFSPNTGEDEFFAVTLKYGMAFAWWDRKNGKLEIHIPEKKKFGLLRESCYVPGRRTVASVTNHGRIIIWADTVTDLIKVPVSNQKNFVKLVPTANNCPINDVKSMDGMLVTCDEFGDIRFYDADIRLVFICSFWKFPAIDFMFPVMIPKEYKLIDADNFDFEETPGVELVYKTSCPTDFTLQRNFFLVREFYITTRVGEILHCNILKKTTEPILFRADDVIASFDYVQQKPWLVSANADGRIYFLDYGKLSVIRDHRLKRYMAIDEDDTGEYQPKVSCVRISADGNHLAVGYDNGGLWMIDPLTIIPITDTPVRHSHAAIREIVFNDRRFCAYADANSTVIFLHYDNDQFEWTVIGKYRYHQKPIVLLAMVENAPQNNHYMISLGQDRLFVEYDLDKSLRKQSLEIGRDKLLEQAGCFTAAKIFQLSKIVNKDTSKNGMVILVADDQYKFKIFDMVTMERLYTFVGPIFDSPITAFVKFTEPHAFCNNFIIFGTEKTLGCILLPIDGNMYRYTGVIAHPKMINILIPWGTGVFALGKGDAGGVIWNIEQENIMKYFHSGGKGLEPYCKFIPGGKEGWMFKEMQDMFYYMQIMTRGSDAPEEHVVTDFISIDDLADYMRSIGYFPSDYDIECLKMEATRTTSPSIPPPTQINFQDTVIMYLNHKPVSGYHLDDIVKTIEYLADQHSSDFFVSHQIEGNAQEDETEITLEKILEILVDKGERVSRELGQRYLIELLSEEAGKLKLSKLDVENEFRQLPDIFTAQQFCAELLGIDVKETTEGRLIATLGEAVNPANIDSQLENKVNVEIPESGMDIEQEQQDADERKSVLRQGRIIKIMK